MRKGEARRTARQKAEDRTQSASRTSGAKFESRPRSRCSFVRSCPVFVNCIIADEYPAPPGSPVPEFFICRFTN